MSKSKFKEEMERKGVHPISARIPLPVWAQLEERLKRARISFQQFVVACSEMYVEDDPVIVDSIRDRVHPLPF
jgi:hypothetical protein